MRKPLRAWTFFGIIATICSAIIGLRLYTNAYTPPVSNSIPSSLSFPHVLQSNGRTDLVQWDGYSLFVMHQRIFLCSGEFHTWRLPNVHLWRDILQKIKALGMNAISVYVHWCVFHSPLILLAEYEDDANSRRQKGPHEPSA